MRRIEIETWLNSIIYHQMKLKELACPYGERYNSEFIYCDSITEFNNKMVVHIHIGLKKIADELGLELLTEKNGFVYYKYQDVLLLELRDRGGELK